MFQVLSTKKNKLPRGGSRGLVWWHQHCNSFIGFAISWGNVCPVCKGNCCSAYVFEKESTILIHHRVGSFLLNRCTEVLSGFLQKQGEVLGEETKNLMLALRQEV